MFPRTDPIDIPLPWPTNGSSDCSPTPSSSATFFRHGRTAGGQSHSKGANFPAPYNYNAPSSQGYGRASPCSSDMRLSTPTEGSISIAMGTLGGPKYTDTSLPTGGSVYTAAGTWVDPEGTNALLPIEDGVSAGIPLSSNSSERSSTLPNSTNYPSHGRVGLFDNHIFPSQGYAGAWPWSSDMYLPPPTNCSIRAAARAWEGSNMSPPTEGSVSIATEAWGSSEDTDMSPQTEGSVPIATVALEGSEDTDTSLPTSRGYTNHGHTTETWVDLVEGDSGAAPAPFGSFWEPRTDANERSPSSSNSGHSWNPLEMLRETPLPSASNPSPERRSLINELYAESLPEYVVLLQVDRHGHHIDNADISGVVGSATSVRPLVFFNSLPQHSYLFPTAHGQRHSYPWNNRESFTGYGGIPSQTALPQVSTSHPTPLHEPDNPIGTTAVCGPPPPPALVTPARSKSPSNGTTSEAYAKKRAVGKDVHRVKRKRACFVCRQLKERCDPVPGACCQRCLARRRNSKVSRWLIDCNLSPMADRWVLMLTSNIVGHLQDHEMKKYFASASIQPLGCIVRAEWTWGYGPALVMEMEEISTSLTRSSSFRLDADEKSHEHLRGSLVPIWIGENQYEKVRDLVERHIRGLVSSSLRGFSEFYRSEVGGSRFQSKFLEIICRFHQTSFGKGSPELTRALELFVLCLFMSENLYLTPESRRELGRSMSTWEDNPDEEYPTPAIALRQLKQQLLPMQVDWMKVVLNDINRLCTRHERPNWSIAFAILILFALICQDLQTSAMLGGIWEDDNRAKERNYLPYDYTNAWECIMAMETDGFGILAQFFKLGYRNFNPLEGDLSADVNRDLDQGSLAFITDVRHLLDTEGKQSADDVLFLLVKFIPEADKGIGKVERNRVRERELVEPMDKIPPKQFAVWNASRLVLNLLPNPDEPEEV